MIKSKKRYEFEIVIVTFSYAVAESRLQRFLALSTLCFSYHSLHFRNTILWECRFVDCVNYYACFNYGIIGGIKILQILILD